MSTEIIGRWAVRLRTPIGSIPIELVFDDADGHITGSATSMAEAVQLHDIRTEAHTDGLRISWRQSITKPMRLDLDFEVAVADDRMSGHSRAGRLPKSSVTGTRLDAEGGEPTP